MSAATLLTRRCGSTVQAGSARPAALARIRTVSRGSLKLVCFRQDDKPVSRDVEKAVQRNVARVSQSMTGLLSNPSTQSSAYWTLGSAAIATAAAAMLLPGVFAGLMFGAATDPVVDSIARAAGATLIASATVKYTLKVRCSVLSTVICSTTDHYRYYDTLAGQQQLQADTYAAASDLQEASLRGQLYMDTFQRLNLGLLLQSGLCLVVLAQAISLRNPLLTAFLGTLCGATMLLSSRIYYLNKAGWPLPSLTKTLSGAISVLLPRNSPATMYSLLTMAFAGMAAMCLGASPGRPLVMYEGLSGPMTVFLHRVAGAGMLLQTLMAYSLKDGADREKLGATTFRWLNLGLAGSLLVMVSNMTMDWQSGVLVHGPKTAGLLAAQIAAFMWTSYMYVAGESKAKRSTPMPAPASG
eukprot:GHRQ01007541.1.p1 GENE.GHRQ01007541.1~~GHRQ01007541.1.p1  ORF type:complete len:412 (+),score=105.36 GHRQ01007541.1:881-2116(+)